jgi:hypothetical protein
MLVYQEGTLVTRDELKLALANYLNEARRLTVQFFLDHPGRALVLNESLKVECKLPLSDYPIDSPNVKRALEQADALLHIIESKFTLVRKPEPRSEASIIAASIVSGALTEEEESAIAEAHQMSFEFNKSSAAWRK